jgi:hypothetical protein
MNDNKKLSWVWCHSLVIPVLGRLREEDHELEVSWENISRLCHTQKN